MAAMPLAHILGYAIEFVAQTVILLGALWVMIKIQSLEYHFWGLLASAALGSALDMIPYFGHYMAVLVLYVCIHKVTRADLFPDAVFTVAVAYALMFAANLFLLGALMGDLKPSNIHAGGLKQTVNEMGEESEDAINSEQPAALNQTTNQASGKIITLGKTPKKTGATNSAKLPPAAGPQDKSAKAPAKPAGKPKELDPAQLARETAKKFSVKGITKSATNPMAMINNGVKTYTMAIGESFSMQTPGGIITVRCEEVGEDSVVLNVAGERMTLVLE